MYVNIYIMCCYYYIFTPYQALKLHLPQQWVHGLRWKDTLTGHHPKFEPLGHSANTSDLSGRPLSTFAELSTVVDFKINTKNRERRG